MNKLLVVLKFEFSKTIKSKPFRILTLLMVIIIAAVLSIPMLKDNFSGKEDETEGVSEIKAIGIKNTSTYDDDSITSLFGRAFPENEIVGVDETVEQSKAFVKDEEYEFIVIIDDVDSYTLITRPAGINDSTSYIINGILLDYYKTYLLTESGLSAEEAGRHTGSPY